MVAFRSSHRADSQGAEQVGIARLTLVGLKLLQTWHIHLPPSQPPSEIDLPGPNTEKQDLTPRLALLTHTV